MSARWGLVATVLAPPKEILQFAAYHLNAGAHRVYLYLDDPDADSFAALKAHPKIRVQRCDAAYWRKINGKRPVKHQVRQSLNATHAYQRKVEVEWLIHMDVDEFIVCDSAIESVLNTIPRNIQCARLRPMEQLVGDGTAFKAFIPNGPARFKTVCEIYPEFGAYLTCGFLSHVAGKLFVRTGLDNMNLRIHNVFQGDAMNPNQIELPAMDLAHCHAKPWEDWHASFAYRFEKGSYRAELAPAQKEGASLHDMFDQLNQSEGAAGLKRFYETVACDTPALRARLEKRGLLRHADLDLDAKLRHSFPQYA